MTNRRLVKVITGVLILAVLLPVILSIWLAHYQAQEIFTEELDDYADRVMMRTDKVLAQAKQAIKEIDAFQGAPCSPEHRMAMRRVSYSNRYIQEVLYLNNLTPQCSSLENHSRGGVLPPPRRITPDGYRAWLTLQNDIGIKRLMGALGSDRHVVMIDPVSLIDVLPFGTWVIDVALVNTDNNEVIASSAPFKPGVIAHIQRHHLTQLKYNDTLYNLKRYPELGVAIIARAPLAPLEKRWHRQMLIWLPFGLLMSLLLSGFLVHYLRRLQSPHYRMLDAINAREIEVYYQPIVTLGSGKIVGAEALTRWPQGDGSFLSPDMFIPLAEQTGLMPQLTTLVIEKVFEDLGDWLHQHPEQHVSINLNPGDLTSPDLPARLHEQLARWQIAPSQIALELTERGFADPAISAPAIAAFRKAGHAVYIDDFGTGYSSLSYLQNLDVDIIKIDKSFVSALEYKNVTPHIIEMAKTLGLAMVAEGIETEGQREWLRNHGVQFGQGWLYSKALPKEAFMAWAEENLRYPLTPALSPGERE
ncbi:EAL domain-containing protein [Enterobacter sp.]|uniref:EAL domain-containing protein n=1 Tax=Enterobacter sp. TaxID=42895 RepID=UPI00298298DF|nr:EAL domain-containing protein [Enterobacter sp.]